MSVHTSANARLISFAIEIRIRIPIRIPIRDPDRHRNLIVCSPARCQPSLKISCKCVRKFLRKVANRQRDKQTDKQRRTYSLLGGGNKPNQCRGQLTNQWLRQGEHEGTPFKRQRRGDHRQVFHAHAPPFIKSQIGIVGRQCRSEAGKVTVGLT